MLKRIFSGPQPQYYPTPYPNYNPNPGYFDTNRYQTEINELKRINSEMLKRITRLENYLGIRGENENIY